MKYLIIFLFSFNVNAGIIFQKSDGSKGYTHAGKVSSGVTILWRGNLTKAQARKVQFINIVNGKPVLDQAAFDAFIAARSAKESRQTSIDYDALTVIQKKKILNRMIKDYLKRKDFDPSDL